MEVVCATVAELISELQKLPGDAIPISIEPPFDAVKLVVQENGKVLFCRPRAPVSLSRPKAA